MGVKFGFVEEAQNYETWVHVKGKESGLGLGEHHVNRCYQREEIVVEGNELVKVMMIKKQWWWLW